MRKKFVFLIALFVLPSVFAADPISSALTPFKSFSPAGVYHAYGPFLDFVLYVLLFMGVSTFALKDHFKENKAVPTVVGIVFSIATAVFTNRIGFKITDLGPYTLMLFFFLIMFFTFRLITGLGVNGRYAAAWGFVIGWALFVTIGAPIINGIPQDSLLLAIYGIVNIVFLIALIFAMIGAITWATLIGTDPAAQAAAGRATAGAQSEAGAGTDPHGAGGAAAAGTGAAAHPQEFEELRNVFGNFFNSIQQTINNLQHHVAPNLAAVAAAAGGGKNAHLNEAHNAFVATLTILERAQNEADAIAGLASRAFITPARRTAAHTAASILRGQIHALRTNVLHARNWTHQGIAAGAPAQKNHRAAQSIALLGNGPGHAGQNIARIREMGEQLHNLINAGP